MEKLLKWLALVVCTACMLLTASNGYPQNLILGVIGNGLWTAAGLYSKDVPLTIASAFSTFIFFCGSAYYIS